MPTPTYTLIQEQTANGSTATFTFSNIPQTYKDLVIECMNSMGVTGTGISMTFNNDTGTNYSYSVLAGDGTSAFSFRRTNYAGIQEWGGISAYSNITYDVLQIFSYANTSMYKTCLIREAWGAAGRAQEFVGLWRNTAAISTITLTAGSNLSSGSTIRLWGVVG